MHTKHYVHGSLLQDNQDAKVEFWGQVGQTCISFFMTVYYSLEGARKDGIRYASQKFG